MTNERIKNLVSHADFNDSALTYYAQPHIKGVVALSKWTKIVNINQTENIW